MIVRHWSSIADFFVGVFDFILGVVRHATILMIDWLTMPLQALVWTANQIIQFIPGVSPIPEVSGASILEFVGLAEGGIVTGPVTAVLGEGGHPEAVVPLDESGITVSTAEEHPVEVRIDKDDRVVALLTKLVSVVERGARRGMSPMESFLHSTR